MSSARVGHVATRLQFITAQVDRGYRHVYVTLRRQRHCVTQIVWSVDFHSYNWNHATNGSMHAFGYERSRSEK